MREGDLGMMEEPTQDIVNIRVVSGDLKGQDKKMDESPTKIDKSMNLSTEIERFQLEHSAFCRTKIINMDASSLLPTKRSPDLAMNREYPFAGGTHPPTSPRTSRNLYEIWKRYIYYYTSLKSIILLLVTINIIIILYIIGIHQINPYN